jgi:chromosome partitioning protein
MPRITVFNQKGGVGKTTTALNLAAALARAGESPLTIDLDPQAHLSFLSGVTVASSDASVYAFFRDNKPLTDLVCATERNSSLIPAHLELAKVDTQFGKGPNVLNRLKLALIRENLNGVRPVIIDCCPLLGVLSLSAIFAADKVLVPVSADYLAVKGALQVEKTLNALGPVLKKRIERRYVITRFDSRRKMSWEIDKTFRERFGSDVCETKISESVSLAESPFAETDVFEHAPGSRGALDYQALYEELKANDFLAIAA